MFCNNLLIKFAGQRGVTEWALGTEVPGTPSLQLLLLTPRAQPLAQPLIRAEGRAFATLASRACSPSPGWPHLSACALGANPTARGPALARWREAPPSCRVYRHRCTIGLYLQNTSSKIKLLRISRLQQPQSIKPSSRALLRGGREVSPYP